MSHDGVQRAGRFLHSRTAASGESPLLCLHRRILQALRSAVWFPELTYPLVGECPVQAAGLSSGARTTGQPYITLHLSSWKEAHLPHVKGLNER